MVMWDSGKIAEVLGGKLLGSQIVSFQGCALDSRKVGKGELFAAIRGEKTDGHAYIRNAFEAGASIVLAEEAGLKQYGLPEIPGGKAVIVIQDSVRSLQDLARAYRDEMDPLVVGITGSGGKTTTKDMVAAVLAQKYRVHKNKENNNNELGLPLTILTAPAGTEVLVLEMGMRGLGQIKALCEICRPTLGVITNIGTTHMELLGTQERIAQAKWELMDSLPQDGTAILNAEDYYSVHKAGSLSIKKLFYGIKGEYVQPDVLGSDLKAEGSLKTSFLASGEEAQQRVLLPLPGEHNVLDALAALALGLSCGIPLEKGALALEEFELSRMRLEILPGTNGSTIISDVYNANPASMKASLEILAQRGGSKTIAVLGDMYELGAAAMSSHIEVGQVAAELAVTELVTVGKLAKDIAKGALKAGLPADKIHICTECEEAGQITEELLKQMGSGAWVLIKGSRGMKMERISKYLEKG